MADLRSEEEQLDVAKRWWKENGTSLIAGAVLAAAGVFGWNAWQNYQEGQSEAASARYQQLVTITAANSLEEEQRAAARELISELTERMASIIAHLRAFARRDRHAPERVALQPALEALRDKGIAAAAQAAEQGAKATAQMGQARAGRSSYVGSDNLAGVEDPGAVAVAGVFKAITQGG